jgi:hypothetical protein
MMAVDAAMVTPWRVRQARLSLLHTEFDPTRLGQAKPRLASTADYQGTFSSLLAANEASSLELPFDRNAGNRNSYWAGLLGPDYRECGVGDLMSRVVPLRARPRLDIQVPAPSQPGLAIAAIRPEGFVYPHAVVTVVSMDVRGDATLAETADWIAAVAKAPATVQGEGTRLADLAAKVSSHVRSFCGFDISSPDLKDFRIFSVINGLANGEELAENAVEWAAVRGITALRDDWAKFALPVTGKLTLSWGRPKLALFNENAVSYVLASNFKNKSSNSCYHRNQLLLATHLFALIPLVLWGEPHLQAHDTTVEAERLVPAAAKTIMRLRGRYSYRSALTTPLAELLDPENKVRTVAGMA